MDSTRVHNTVNSKRTSDNLEEMNERKRFRRAQTPSGDEFRTREQQSRTNARKLMKEKISEASRFLNQDIAPGTAEDRAAFKTFAERYQKDVEELNGKVRTMVTEDICSVCARRESRTCIKQIEKQSKIFSPLVTAGEKAIWKGYFDPENVDEDKAKCMFRMLKLA